MISTFNHGHRLIPLLIIISLTACGNNTDNSNAKQALSNTPVKPGDALSTFELPPGFKIELVASEPLISDPVDMEIDEYGHMYVVEMHGYPLDKSGTGIIKLLSDTDGDGQMDKSTVFAGGLTLPNSIMRWKKGVLVTDAPDVFYLEDTTGDGRADKKEVMLTGFALSNPQHNLNSPVLGIDNWIYLAHEGAVATQTYKKEFGDTGTAIYYPQYAKSPRLPPNASGRAVRFRPDQHLLETTSSNTQFGHTFDNWGHHFLVTNYNHILQEVLAASYLKRNPKLLISNATQSLSDHSDASEVFPITKNPERQLLTDVGVITSACGITHYGGGTFPAPFDNAVFVAEPVSNLIHVDKLTDSGASFKASRILEHKEFLASTDSWFRPVNMYIGPDGALYVIDYYRQIIEHPEWMGEEVVKSGQLYNGHDMGRIYRITSTNTKKSEWTKGIGLGDAPSEQLVEYLSNENGWWRLNAQRLLVDRQDKNSVPLLIKMTQNTSSSLGRLHALWTLEGLSSLSTELIQQALKDPVAGVRENAIKLAELHLSSVPQLSNLLLPLQDDADAKVRFQLLCTLGSVNTPGALNVRNKLLFRNINDQWMQIAALSGSSSQTGSLLKMVLDSFQQQPAYASLIQRLSSMIGAGENSSAVKQLIQKAITLNDQSQAAWQAPLLEGLAMGLKTKKQSVSIGNSEENMLVKTFFEHPSGKLRNAAFNILKLTNIHNAALKSRALQNAILIAKDQSQPADKRVEAIGFISLGSAPAKANLMEQLINPREPSSVQLAAVRTLSMIPDSTVSIFLVQQWPNLTPEVQNEALNSFLVNDNRIALLLNALENGSIQISSVGWHRSVRLMAQKNLQLREKARRLLTKNEKDRTKVNSEYQPALSLNGDPEKGKTVYVKNCSSCHQVRGTMGVNFGPDLGTIHNWSADAIMANILAPDLSISSGYDLWSVELNNGETFQGVISSETATSITLTNAGRETRTINRTDIKTMKGLNMSSMPAGLEKQINHRQMADLLAFLRENK